MNPQDAHADERPESGGARRFPSWRDVRFWVPRAMRQRCRVDYNWTLNRVEKVAYATKVVVLLLLGRERLMHWREDPIEVAYANERQWAGAEMTMYAWEALVVLPGFLRPRDWWFAVREESAP